ncbi:MAG: hypothetical protein ACE5IR_05700 [bacterium]
MAKVPKKFHDVFWEVDAEKLDTEEYPEYIMERILDFGTLAGVKWLRGTLGDEKIRKYVSGPRRRGLSSRTLNFWHKIYKIRPEECAPIFSVPNRLSFWNS